MNTCDLLARYAATGSEEAFTGLVRHYTNFVFSVAKRRVNDIGMAEDVTQTIFTRLAKSPPKLRNDAELAAWLHRTTIHVAIDFWRAESRRRVREQKASIMQPATTESTGAWEELSPHLDEALDELNDADRQTVLLRFFEGMQMRDVGRVLGVSEDAAKMRVSRAVDRLRNQLALRGVTCTVIGLATVLTQRAVEAAPGHLVASLGALKRAMPVATAGIGGMTSLIPRLVGSKAVMGTGALLIVATVTFFLLLHSGNTENEATSVPGQTVSPEQQAAPTRGNPFFSKSGARTHAAIEPELSADVRLILQVVDSETAEGLPGSKIRAVYFYAGGVPEAHDLETDQDGKVTIPKANKNGDRGMNIFVSAESHVPKCLGWSDRTPTNYIMKLDAGMLVAGRVIDEQGQPVSGVKVTVQGPGSEPGQKENVDFQTSGVISDATGKWHCSYIPKDWKEIRFNLAKRDYAVTLPLVTIGMSDLSNLVLVIDRGYTLTGRITDPEGKPIPGVRVKESNNSGNRRQSTKSDLNGLYSLPGLAGEYTSFQQRPDKTNEFGVVQFGGFIGVGEPRVEVAVQGKGFASQRIIVPLVAPTNVLNLTLTKGNIFRGRVIDENGIPIPKAVVRIDFDFKNQIDSGFEWLAETDAEGRFEWDSAPVEAVCFWFEADGYEVIRGMSILADGTNHEIKLMRKRAFLQR